MDPEQHVRHPVVRSVLRVLVYVVALAATYAFFVISPTGQQLDSGSFGPFGTLNRQFGGIAGSYRTIAPFALAAVAVVLGIWELLHRRLADPLRAVIVVAVSFAVSEGLKDILQRPDYGIGGYSDNTFPSGHVALTVSIVVGIGILIRRRRTVVMAALALVVVVAAWASVVSYAHRPSDTISASLVVGAVAAVVLWGQRVVLDAAPWLGVTAAVLMVGGGVLLGAGATSSAGEGAVLAGWLMLCGVPAAFVLSTAPTARRASSYSQGTDPR